MERVQILTIVGCPSLKVSPSTNLVQQFYILAYHLSNQIRVVAFNVPQLTQASFLQKKSNVAKCFFDICNAEMAESLSSLQKSEFLSYAHFSWILIGFY